MAEKRGNWWQDAKFGMFIHWGLYALAAGEYGGRKSGGNAEWIMHDLDIPPEAYRRQAEQFNPVDFDANAIVRLCRDAGMRYLVFTAKHHDGFAMYHSRANRYNVVDATPFGRDVAMELKQACDRHGIRLCFYYSQAQDWDHPGGLEEGRPVAPGAFAGYLEEKCVPQVRELLTGYGPLGLIWYDTPMDMPHKDCLRMRDLVRELQPDCLVSGRVGHGLGDYMTTGDDFIPLLPYAKPFEVPATMNGTWGYAEEPRRWKRPERMLRDLVRIVSRGGNYLLNIGPDARGNVPQKSVEALRALGEFMRLNGESIYGTRPVPTYPYDIEWGYFTAKPGKLFIHVFEDVPEIYLINMGNTPRRAYLLADATPLTVVERETCEHVHSWRIALPEGRPRAIDTVICVEVAEQEIFFEPLED